MFAAHVCACLSSLLVCSSLDLLPPSRASYFTVHCVCAEPQCVASCCAASFVSFFRYRSRRPCMCARLTVFAGVVLGANMCMHVCLPRSSSISCYLFYAALCMCRTPVCVLPAAKSFAEMIQARRNAAPGPGVGRAGRLPRPPRAKRAPSCSCVCMVWAWFLGGAKSSLATREDLHR
jgi:hypothetical protein